jgi:cytochrome o ubiquinol oxidase subunit 2
MGFKVHAVPDAQFAAWAAGQRGKGSALDGRAYAELSKPSSYVKPTTYGGVAPGLFDAIVANRAPANPIPAPAHNRPVNGSKA